MIKVSLKSQTKVYLLGMWQHLFLSLNLASFDFNYFPYFTKSKGSKRCFVN